MGRRKDKHTAMLAKSQTLPSSPTHSSSSSDFEFTISLSPRKASATNLCPADELFYKGQLLPLHLSPRISMVRTLLLASSSTSSSSDTTTTASRDSTGSSNDSHSSFSSDLLLLPADLCDSSRPSSVTAEEEDQFKRLNFQNQTAKKTNYFSSRFSKFSSVFRKESTTKSSSSSSSVKRMSVTAKEVIRKYLKKVKPLYEKLSSQKQTSANVTMKSSSSDHAIGIGGSNFMKADQISGKSEISSNNMTSIAHSFSGNLRYPIRRSSCVSSCPSSMRSSPSHSGILCKSGGGARGTYTPPMGRNGNSSSMEELQNAIQGAIAHCKNSMMIQNKSTTTMVSHEI
ncbi:hypothetical protein M9H77_35110 [Catharanthus roseus]|uniref:Uncharacterized protein n=1 Tax=Catharanthus roseus TaxID=4058 RepID=A0ACB9ZRQ9_CATRO|nr:hypothetical protein M9H77_35110 [Catharanthus roseus]